MVPPLSFLTPAAGTEAGGQRPGWKHMAPFTSRAAWLWMGGASAWGTAAARLGALLLLRAASYFGYSAIVSGIYEDVLLTFMRLQAGSRLPVTCFRRTASRPS